MKSPLRTLIAVLIVLAIAGIVFFVLDRPKVDMGSFKQELTAETVEIKECQDRLAMFYVAIEKYRKDHKGADPDTIEKLLPAYIKPEALYCPTAKRWDAKGRKLNQGDVTVNGTKYPMSYGFKLFSANYPFYIKKNKNKAIMIQCESHGEALYISAYKKAPLLGVYSPENRKLLIPELLAEAKNIALFPNGRVELVDSDSE